MSMANARLVHILLPLRRPQLALPPYVLCGRALYSEITFAGKQAILHSPPLRSSFRPWIRMMASDVGPSQASPSTQSPSLRRPIQVGPTPRYRSREEMYAVRARKNRSLLMYTGAVIITFLGLTYAAVPLYRLFCSATGFAGTPSTRTQATSGPEFPEWMPEWLKTLLSPSTAVEDRFAPSRLIAIDPADDPKSRRFKVTFTSSTSTALPWTFKPAQHHVYVLPGESSLAFYTAKNNSKDDIIGVATYNVTPDRIAPYFSKIECFCFDEQKLLSSETVDMPLLFFIDKDVLEDPSCRNVEDVVLSYTFFKARRNQQGQLEPDAPEDVVQKSLGFESYELAKKASESQKE
ncbi:cytochrome c oxidase assembly protein CtaG/Cox11, domain-containing protein [Lentinula raphanica]|uniref:Cytochrome c oxidase assembly protein CtaG/Cox11, domain-containing protein n=1 Tax=Lentinula raphanica TaxID=153919 RepID=A0AA38UCN7_9AGAR|nr:cytochrome c oxidase assembly protein CtaG/Cox11, domain-containing protein [Lentinula raphanica]KAJ3977220.1 cytochrome c oxidase assembly protein CtaG/Cox11, domain-containing protein [Lentinula raphanica]